MHKIKCWSSSDSVLMVIEVAKVVLKVKTDLLMNAVTAATNTHFYVLSLSPLRKCLTFFFNSFSHLAHSKCCKLSLLVKICFLRVLSHSLSLFSTCFFHLTSSLLLWPIAPYFLMPSSLLSFSLSASHTPIASRLLPSFSPFLLLVG